MTTRILYVDDEADIREVVGMALSLDPDFDVALAASGEAALDWLAGQPATPDLILLDFMMPGLDGPATLARLRGDPRHAATPVVFLTARTGGADVERLMALGAIGVLAKPFDPMTLAAEVRALLAR